MWFGRRMEVTGHAVTSPGKSVNPPPPFTDCLLPVDLLQTSVAGSAGGMAGPRPLLSRILRLAAAVSFLACACFPASVYGIRKDIGFSEPIICRSTVQGRYLISDHNGYVCSAFSINPWSHCCPETGDRFSCQGCKLDLQCCNTYEYCVSCCLNPSKTKKEDVLKLKVAKPITAGTYTNVFDFCMGRCRHSSASVVHENAYTSDFHHCFSMQQNSSGSTESSSLSKLLGINVVVGRPGESCSLVCKVRGQSCVPSRLSVLNKCEILGPDQPAEVVDEAPTSLEAESINHLLSGCVLSREVWAWLLRELKLNVLPPTSSSRFCSWWKRTATSLEKSLRKGFNSLVILVSWELWKHRNACVFDGVRPQAQTVLTQNPGACLYMQMDERLTCDGSHQHTRRLCPCA
ncbi:hypothetical protein U9M48_033340 [Paspalum notatum var. saurae]|uniref:SREBP regulating gene protein n=1 Tax=Paspalum notatum var. saurae TaxID=547442 RepID=A0AAQ3UAF9_PASNO